MNINLYSGSPTGFPTLLAQLEWKGGKLFHRRADTIPDTVLDWTKWTLQQPGVTGGSLTVNGVTYQFSTGATKKKKSSSLTAQATTPIAHSIDPIQRAVDDGRRKLRMAETRHNPELDAVFGR